jgi:hypothetical protein
VREGHGQRIARRPPQGISMEEAVKQLTDIPAINRFLSYCRVRTVPSKTA